MCQGCASPLGENFLLVSSGSSPCHILCLLPLGLLLHASEKSRCTPRRPIHPADLGLLER